VALFGVFSVGYLIWAFRGPIANAEALRAKIIPGFGSPALPSS